MGPEYSDVIMFATCIILLLVLALVFSFLTRKSAANLVLRKELDDTREQLKKTVSQKKSSEVRLGKIGENMAPFFSAWPYNPNKFRFLGDPVDGIQFGEDEVIFVEIKTGKARLTTSQKTVKQLVKEGKVKFVTFRVGENGCELKLED